MALKLLEENTSGDPSTYFVQKLHLKLSDCDQKKFFFCYLLFVLNKLLHISEVFW